MLDNFDRALRNVSLASDRSQSLFREIAGQGPQKTLGRGFAVVRSIDGTTVTAVAHVTAGAQIEVSMRDGVVGAVVSTVKKSNEEGDS